VLESYAGGAPQLRRFCLRCADRWSLESSLNVALKPRPGVAGLLALAGAVFVTVGLLGDYLAPGAQEGFGLHQSLGALAGLMLVLIGILLRAQVIALGGLLLLAVAVSADWFGVSRGAGIGWKQLAMIEIGAAGLLLAGIYPFARDAVVRRLERTRRAALEGDGA
jgi:hypothetical protein